MTAKGKAETLKMIEHVKPRKVDSCLALSLMVFCGALAVLPAQVAAQSQAPTKVLITNASIFNGKDENLASGMLEDINLIADPDKNFKMIMKDGEIYKNTLR